jgi:Helicase HerA, central domain
MPHTILGASSDDRECALSLQERLRHIGIFGITGVGKSTLLRNIAAQDMARGDGLLLLDPHGPLAEDLLPLVPRQRVDEVCYFNAGDREFPVGFNIVGDVLADDQAVVAEGVVSAMRAIWLDISWGPELERILRSSVIALIQTPRVSLVHLPRLLTDDIFRAYVISRTTNPVVRQFFERQYNPRPEDERLRMIASVLNKIEAFLASDPLRNILGQDMSTLHLDHAMRHGRIVIANLSKGAIGETPAELLGGLLLARALAALMGRRRDKALRPFHIIVDEAAVFKTGLAPLLREARKFFGSLTLATQDIASLDDHTRNAIMGSTLLPARP